MFGRIGLAAAILLGLTETGSARGSVLLSSCFVTIGRFCPIESIGFGLLWILLIASLVAFFRFLRGARRKPPSSEQIEAYRSRIQPIIDNCIERVSANWLFYNKKIIFNDGVALSEKVKLFAMPTRTFISSNYPNLNNLSEDMFWELVRKAIVRSGTHPKADVNQAVATAGNR